MLPIGTVCAPATTFGVVVENENVAVELFNATVRHAESSDVFPVLSSVAVAVIASPPLTGAVIPEPVSMTRWPEASVVCCAQPIQFCPSPFPDGSHEVLR